MSLESFLYGIKLERTMHFLAKLWYDLPRKIQFPTRTRVLIRWAANEELRDFSTSRKSIIYILKADLRVRWSDSYDSKFLVTRILWWNSCLRFYTRTYCANKWFSMALRTLLTCQPYGSPRSTTARCDTVQIISLCLIYHHITSFIKGVAMGAFHLRKKRGNFGGSKSGISDW